MQDAAVTLNLLAGVTHDNIAIAHYAPFDPTFPAGTVFRPGSSWSPMRRAADSNVIVAPAGINPGTWGLEYWSNVLWYSEDGQSPLWTFPGIVNASAIRVGRLVGKWKEKEECSFGALHFNLGPDAENKGPTPMCKSFAHPALSDPSYQLPELVFEHRLEPGRTGDVGEIRITKDKVLDALELFCTARAESDAGLVRHCDGPSLAPVQIESIDDLQAASTRLNCMANAIHKAGSHALFVKFPAQAIDALKEESATGVFPALGGDAGATISDIRVSMIELSAAAPLIASQVNQLAFDIEEVRATLTRQDIARRIRELNIQLQDMAQAGQCSQALASGVISGVTTMGGLGGAGFGALIGAMSCLNGAVQVDILNKINELETMDDAIGRELAELDFRSRFSSRATALGEIANGLSTSQERLDQGLSRLESLRYGALRSINNAVWLKSQQASGQYKINSVLRHRYNTARVRYEEAHGYAKRMALLARRAIEARLGLRLETLDEPLPLVEAPSTWASEVCATAPVDYENIREATDTAIASHADVFIGRYVDRLEAVVESYRLVRNFHEGHDTAVISLRDDVFNVRAACKTEGVNLLRSSGVLDSSEWAVAGCEVDTGGIAKGNCLATLVARSSPYSAGVADSAPGFSVVFGPGPNADGSASACDDACGLTDDTRLEQKVRLGPGSYILSWHSKQDGSGNPDGSNSLVVLSNDGVPVPLDDAELQSEMMQEGWSRHFRRFSVEDDDGFGDYAVAVVPVGGDVPQRLFVAGIMVERSDGVAPPANYEASDADGLVAGQACEDSDGREFRATRWTRDCVLLCNNGFSGDCAEDQRREYCYHESSFSISQEDIELGRVLKRAGFALGNFNYRIEDLALNFVALRVNLWARETPRSC